MTQAVLVIHGAGEPRLRDGRIYWQPMLSTGLGTGYEVEAPRMPDPEDPHFQPWAHRIAALLEHLDRPILIGHSFGASVILKYLAQSTPRPAYRGLFLVSTPFWKATFPEYAFTQEELPQLSQLAPTYFYHSRDDAEVGLDHLDRYAHFMPQAVFRVLDGRGHEFNQPAFPELVADIHELPTAECRRGAI